MDSTRNDTDKDVGLVHEEATAPTELAAVRKTADQEKIVATLADEVLPGVELNTDPAFEKALVRKFDRRLLLMMMGYVISTVNGDR